MSIGVSEARAEIDRFLEDNARRFPAGKVVRRRDILLRLQDLQWHPIEEFMVGDFQGRYRVKKGLTPRQNLEKNGLKRLASQLEKFDRRKLKLETDYDRDRVRLTWVSSLPIRAITASAIEGIMIEWRGYRKGRSRKLRDLAMEQANGVCAACDTNFAELLNGRGTGVLQVHHRKQLSDSDRPPLTTLEDLAVVCANCHMLIHTNRRSPLSVEELRLQWQQTPATTGGDDIVSDVVA